MLTFEMIMALISLYVTLHSVVLYQKNKKTCSSQNELLLITLMVSGLAGTAYYAAMYFVSSYSSSEALKHGRDIFNVLIPLAFLNVIRHKFKQNGDREKTNVTG